MPIFASFGEIYQFRLMMSFSGENRGYGYLLYTNDEDTKLAIHFLKTIKIGENLLHVRPSKNNCVLILGHINVTLDFATIVKMINNLSVAKKVYIFIFCIILTHIYTLHSHIISLKYANSIKNYSFSFYICIISIKAHIIFYAKKYTGGHS